MTHNPPTRQLDLDAIEARANAATSGPWCTDSWEIYQGTEYEPGLSTWIGETCRGMTSAEQDRADAAFVAAARTDVPALVAEVRRLRDQVAAVTALHEKGEHNGLDICLHCASQMFPPPETGIWSESAWPCATLRALGVDDARPAVRPAVETGA